MALKIRHAMFTLAISAGLTPLAQGAVFQSVRSPWVGIMPVVQPLSAAGMLTASSDLTSQSIRVQQYNRTNNGAWGALTNAVSIPFTAMGDGQWVPQQLLSDKQSHWLLASGVTCDDSTQCRIRAHALLKISLDGKTIEGTTSISPTCENPTPPSMHTSQNARIVFDGCDTLFRVGVTMDTQLITKLSGSVLPSAFNPSFFWGRLPDSTQTRLQIVSAETGQAIAESTSEGLMIRCEEVLPTPGELIAIECAHPIKENEKEKEVWQRFSMRDQLTSTTIDTHAPALRAYLEHDGHAYTLLQQDADLFAVNAQATDPKLEFSRRTLTAYRNTSALQAFQRTPEIKMEPSGFYSVLPVTQGQDRIYLLMYDGIPQDFAPFVLSGTTQTLPSGQQVELPWKVMDEDSLPEQLITTQPDAPGWLSFSAAAQQVIAKPEHSDVGRYTFEQSISDPAGNQTAINWDLTVDLSPVELMVYEPDWFKQWGLDEPVPYASLIKQIKQLPILEDKPFAWTFSVRNRRAEDVAFASQHTTAFIQTAAPSGQATWTGTALQQDVGEYTMNLSIQDTYTQTPVAVEVPLRVIEVDDPFVITSTPPSTVMVNEDYRYALSVEDEESDISKFRIYVIEKPSFLTLNSTVQALEGTPMRRDLGAHAVAVVLEDEAGHRTLHQWHLTVTEPVAESTSGGSTSLSWLFLVVIALFRRRVPA